MSNTQEINITNEMIYEKLVELTDLMKNVSISKPKVIKESQILSCDSCEKTTFMNSKNKEVPIKRKNKATNCKVHSFCRPCWLLQNKICKKCPETTETTEIPKIVEKKAKKTIKKVVEPESESETESQKQLLDEILNEKETLKEKSLQEISDAIDNLSD